MCTWMQILEVEDGSLPPLASTLFTEIQSPLNPGLPSEALISIHLAFESPRSPPPTH